MSILTLIAGFAAGILCAPVVGAAYHNATGRALNVTNLWRSVAETVRGWWHAD